MSTIISFIYANWQPLLSILAIFLSGGVAIAHMFHADKIEKSLQDLADVIGKLNTPNPPASK